ncbi:MAG: phenylacetate--CoA ligase family protein [Gammaproteobacteria bacterium]|nr:phenylacetate--CoA ligase family protein [Gammaproteobacteria bacterium]
MKIAPSAVPRSSVSGIVWPALPDPGAASMLAMQYQLEQSQWWTADQLRAQQFRQLHALLTHAWKSIPFYQERLKAAGFDPRTAVTPETFSRLPLLHRHEVQTAGEALLCRQLPQEHGQKYEGKTSGSTGQPLRYSGTQYSLFIGQALTLRDHLLHRRDFQGKLAVIRTHAGSTTITNWGSPVSLLFDTGPAATLDIGASINTQVAWLQEQEPDYLLSYPSNILSLANHCLEHGIKLHRLREVRTLGEAHNPALRAVCRKAWGVPVVDVYSANEIGYIALQCPEHEHYHVQSESVLVEILKEDGTSCQQGEIGKMVVTSLQNYAMPLIRYDIGDLAIAGEPCSCGRGLPVIKCILGRQRNLITLPDGSQHYPITGYLSWMEFLPIRQMQIVQKSLQEVEIKLVTERPLTPEEQEKLNRVLHDSLGYPFHLNYTYHQNIPRGAGGKFEDIISEVSREVPR